MLSIRDSGNRLAPVYLFNYYFQAKIAFIHNKGIRIVFKNWFQ